MTNIEKIRNMSTEDIAKKIFKEARKPCCFCAYINTGSCIDCHQNGAKGIAKWLESEAANGF